MKRVFSAFALIIAATTTSQAATLETVKQRGTLVCGVSTGFAGFSTPRTPKVTTRVSTRITAARSQQRPSVIRRR